jgi:hypothetical protein
VQVSESDASEPIARHQFGVWVTRRRRHEPGHPCRLFHDDLDAAGERLSLATGSPRRADYLRTDGDQESRSDGSLEAG